MGTESVILILESVSVILGLLKGLDARGKAQSLYSISSPSPIFYEEAF